MKKLSVLLVLAVVLNAGATLADTKASSLLKKHAPITAEEAKHLEELKQAGKKHRADVQKAWKQQSRALRGKRRPRKSRAQNRMKTLSPVQREAIRKLRFAPHDWDKKIQAFKSGRNS